MGGLDRDERIIVRSIGLVYNNKLFDQICELKMAVPPLMLNIISL